MADLCDKYFKTRQHVRSHITNVHIGSSSKTIKCPECEALMMVPKLNKAQEVKCDACGLEGEITV